MKLFIVLFFLHRGLHANDNVPAYFIEEGWTDHKDSWQLVFLLNDSGMVREVKIHKNTK